MTPSTNSFREMESTGLQDYLCQKNIIKILTFGIEHCSFYEVSKTLTKMKKIDSLSSFLPQTDVNRVEFTVEGKFVRFPEAGNVIK